ncbi:alpha/beta fold hydrolase [Palleronia caenipelagi]|uniref:Alpha/beta hydrolase n=1 Tax=Palleronia caenipelagi TaxID=2489174 RepID=A0A547QAX3_9RHOB|nr:alpha/beta hydrolase [Palleronia caenipelagi]TRD23522.1 alpha/beta hydrolase [Palleronia caenipelagi]
MADFTTSDGLRLHYEDEGTGTPVLCLAGLTRNSRDFDYVATQFSDMRLIRMDYRGRGQSDWGAPETYDIAIEARDAIELLNHLGVDKSAILGTSRGGIIAMALAATQHDRITGVCLNDIGPEIAMEGIEMIKGYIGKAPVSRTFEEAARARAKMMLGFDNVPHERWLQDTHAQFVDTGDGLGLSYDPALAEQVKANIEAAVPDLWPFFDALAGLPLACIRGANSNLLTQETLAQMQERRPDMIAVEVPDRGHVPFLDEPEAAEALARWKALL